MKLKQLTANVPKQIRKINLLFRTKSKFVIDDESSFVREKKMLVDIETKLHSSIHAQKFVAYFEFSVSFSTNSAFDMSPSYFNINYLDDIQYSSIPLNKNDNTANSLSL